MKSKLETLTDTNSLPKLPGYEVHQKKKKVPKPKSGVPGDPPSRLDLFTEILQKRSCLKIEYGSTLHKVPNNNN